MDEDEERRFLTEQLFREVDAHDDGTWAGERRAFDHWLWWRSDMRREAERQGRQE